MAARVELVELSVDLSVEAQTGQPALRVATLSLVEADLMFGYLVASSVKIAGSTDADRSRVVVLRPALAASALTRIPRIDSARIKTRIPTLPLSIQTHIRETRTSGGV